MIRRIVPSIALALSFCASSPVCAEGLADIRYLQTADGRASYQASDGIGPSTPFALASLGKAMTAVAVLRLVGQGRLGLDDAPQAHLPPDVVAGAILPAGLTLRHLLTMTSGLPDYLDDAFVEDALDAPAKVQTPRAALRYAKGQEALFSPGTAFDYSNTNYVLLGLILEQASGQSFATVLRDQVFDPAGMSGAFVFGSQDLPPDFPQAFEQGQSVRAYYQADGMGDGGVIGSAEDLARFYRALFAGVLLAPVLFAEFLHDPLQSGYGMGIEIDGALVGHSGGDLGFSADLRMDRDSGDIAIQLVASSDAATDWPYLVLGE
jgi:D-alanyl-D-alanine carboxypeptidase